MEKQPHWHKQQEKKPTNNDDICPICKQSLYLNQEYSQRVGLIDEDDMVVGWMCPHCDSSFDLDDKLTGIFGDDIKGEA